MREIAKKVLVLMLLITFVIEPISTNAQSIPKDVTVKNGYGEYIYENGHLIALRRNQYGVMATGIKECSLSSGPYGTSVFVRKTGKNKNNKLYEMGLKYNSFPIHFISKRASKYYPIGGDRILLSDYKNRIWYMGMGHCFFLFKHKKEKDCNYSSDFHKNERVLRSVKKIWSDDGGVAYVKKNALYFTFSSWAEGCYDDESAGVHKYFVGKGNQVKKVVCPYFEGPIFVLMKNGTVWAMGDNKKKLISNSKTKFFDEFKKLKVNRVKDIQSNGTNVVVLKKDSTLWVWGKSLKNKKKYTMKLKKIARNVKEVSIGNSTEGKDRSTILYLKKNGKAYGMGANKGYGSYMLTDEYKKKWISKPVFLMKDIKHVYAGVNFSMLIDKKSRLLWTGYFEGANFYGWLK